LVFVRSIAKLVVWREHHSTSASDMGLLAVEQRNFVTFGKEICQSGFEGGSFDHQRGRNSLIVGIFGEQKSQSSANRIRSFS
jgi:hypothetical protein